MAAVSASSDAGSSSMGADTVAAGAPCAAPPMHGGAAALATASSTWVAGSLAGI